ncbi:MAG: Cadherin domain protein [Planctomycetaceae bacterium]|nr:Cadherin domain protein [Planctomycetaceae bacterium]
MNSVQRNFPQLNPESPPEVLTFSITGGADAALFSIDPSTGVLAFKVAPDFEHPTDAALDDIYSVTVTVDDGKQGTDTQNIAVTVIGINDNAPVFTSPVAFTLNENTTSVGTAVATDADLPAQTLTYSISGGADAALFNINPSTGALVFLAAPDFEAPADAGTDNVYDIQVTADDTTTRALAA